MSRTGRLGKRLRGLLGLGAIGGAVGAVLGAPWGVVVWLRGWDGGPLIEQLLNFGALGFVAGGMCAVGFGGLLATLDRRTSLADLPLWRMALFGAFVGAALPALFLLSTSGTAHFVTVPGLVASIVATGGVLGAGLATTLVGVAKRAHRRELATVEEVASLAE